jgi:hypothetical protein
MTVTSQIPAVPGSAVDMTMVGKWLGPCAKNQKPGDVILPGGRKINIPETRSRPLGRIEPGATPPR